MASSKEEPNMSEDPSIQEHQAVEEASVKEESAQSVENQTNRSREDEGLRYIDFPSAMAVLEKMQKGQGDLLREACAMAVGAARGTMMEHLPGFHPPAGHIIRYKPNTVIHLLSVSVREPMHPGEPPSVYVCIGLPAASATMPGSVWVVNTCNPMLVIAVKVQNNDQGELCHAIYVQNCAPTPMLCTCEIILVDEEDWGKDNSILHATQDHAYRGPATETPADNPSANVVDHQP